MAARLAGTALTSPTSRRLSRQTLPRLDFAKLCPVSCSHLLGSILHDPSEPTQLVPGKGESLGRANSVLKALVPSANEMRRAATPLCSP